eukprot:jgi/Mesvir1/6828/Mv09010-RA.1
MEHPLAEGLSLYEQRRAENIQRNGIVLQQMGLRADIARAQTQQRGSRQRQREQAPPPQPVRKSARLSNMQPAVASTNLYLDDKWETASDEEIDAPRTGKHKAAREGGGGVFKVLPDMGVMPGGPPTDDNHRVRPVPDVAQPPVEQPSGMAPIQPPASEPCKRLNAHLEALRAEFLGQAIIPSDGSGAMKAAVMTRLRGPPYKVVPPFNKYSGMLEWANALVFFVNAEASNYDNTFLSGGRQMRWQAQNTQRLETPVVQRLLSTMAHDPIIPSSKAAQEDPAMARVQGPLHPPIGAQDSDNNDHGGTTSSVVATTGSTTSLPARPTLALFLRQGPSYPYVFCGHVACLRVDKGSNPLSFIFELLDYDQLVSCEDFKRLFDGSSSAKR